MGEADVILGIKIKRENKEIVITQSHYIEKILKKFNREDYSPVSTPMDPIEKLKPNTGKPEDQLEYSRAIGCLMYAMTSSRPDIVYAIGKLSRFTSNPSRHYWKAIIRVFKYLRGTKDYGLSYVGYPSVLEASKKQTCITGSTMESEFFALAVAVLPKWLNHIVREMENIIIKEDATHRISELPDGIIENILLRLDKPKERVRVSDEDWFALTAL
ncbi:hypothetical protein Tco_0832833 [Tanacetum coccineum]